MKASLKFFFLVFFLGWGCAPYGEDQKPASALPQAGSGAITAQQPTTTSILYETVDIYHYWSGGNADPGLRGDRYFTSSTSPGQSKSGATYVRSDQTLEFKLFKDPAMGRIPIYDCEVETISSGASFFTGTTYLGGVFQNYETEPAEAGDHYLGAPACYFKHKTVSLLGYVYQSSNQNSTPPAIFELYQCRNNWSRILDWAATKNKSKLMTYFGFNSTAPRSHCDILGYVP